MNVADLFGEYVEVTFDNGDTLCGVAARAESDHHVIIEGALVRIDAVRSWQRASPDVRW